MSTPEGWYQLETFGMMAPIAVMVVTVAIGSRALAGEEEHRTMGLLLANPVKRSMVVYQKTFAMIIYGIGVGFSIWFSNLVAGSELPFMLQPNTLAAAIIALMVAGLIGAAMSVNRITRVDPIIALGQIQ